MSAFMEAAVQRIQYHQKVVARSLARCRRGVRIFASDRTVSGGGPMNMETQVLFQGQVRTLRYLCQTNVADVISCMDDEVEELLLLHKILLGANRAIARAWFGPNGILHVACMAILEDATGFVDTPRVMAGLVSGMPHVDDNLWLIEKVLGLSGKDLANCVMACRDAFENGFLPALITGGIRLFSVESFAFGVWFLAADANSLSTECLFNILEIFEAMEDSGIQSMKDALALGLSVYRYDKLFQELALEDEDDDFP